MSDVAALVVILALFGSNLWQSVTWWSRYRDLRSVRAVLAAIVMFLGAVALGIALWALRTHGPEQVIETVRLLVWFGEGILLTFGTGLMYATIPGTAGGVSTNPASLVGLDVKRLARAIADHDDICSRMAIPECAEAIARAYASLARSATHFVFPDGTVGPGNWNPETGQVEPA